MRRCGYILTTVVMMIFLSVSCQRRPFAENRTMLSIALKIDTAIVNHTQKKLPENMRVDLYDCVTSQLVFTDYVGPEGGVIHPVPGTYNLLIYSIDAESTIVHKEQSFNTIEAYVNEVSSYLKSQMAQFLSKRKAAAKERITKNPDQYAEQPVVNQPDHIFVGSYDNLFIPVSYEDERVEEVYIEVTAQSLVESWNVEIRNVEGSQWIREVVSLVSGQKGSVLMGPDTASDRIVSVFFEMSLEENQDGGKCLKGKYNTFGKYPGNEESVNIDLSVRDRGGGEQIFHFDVTDKIENNKQRYILIEEPLVIEENGSSGGGFLPVVDEWDNVNTDINL